MVKIPINSGDIEAADEPRAVDVDAINQAADKAKEAMFTPKKKTSSKKAVTAKKPVVPTGPPALAEEPEADQTTPDNPVVPVETEPTEADISQPAVPAEVSTDQEVIDEPLNVEGTQEPNAPSEPEVVSEEVTEDILTDETEVVSDDNSEPIVDNPVETVDEDAQELEDADFPSAETPTVEDVETTEFDDSKTEEAVEEIIRTDSDELLAHEDAILETDFEPPVKMGLLQRLKAATLAWWHNKRLRTYSFIGVGVLIFILMLVPTTRYFALNTAGVRVRASLNVVDEKTQQPLKNVRVSLGGKNLSTDSDGKAEFSGLKLGRSDLKIEKRAFATLDRKLTLGLGSNPLGSFDFRATGATFNFEVRDWLSGKPIEKSEAASGEASAFSDKEGKIALVLDAKNSENPKVTISSPGYRKEIISLPDSGQAPALVLLVPERKHLFVSKRSGNYDLYKIDADGKNEELLLAGSGNERDDMVLAPHPTTELAALVSTRDGARNKDGFGLSGLFLVDVKTGKLSKLAQSERIQIIGWSGDRLVYVRVVEGVSASNPQRHKLISYNPGDQDTKELATSNYFNDVLAIGDDIYYAPSDAYLQNPSSAQLYIVKADGTGKRSILNREAWNVIRTEYDSLAIATDQDWYSFKLGSGVATKASGAPSRLEPKLFVDNRLKTKSLWVDDRDGKGALIIKDIKTGDDKVFELRAGLQAPIYWLSDHHIVFRVSTPDEVADYVVSIEGGKPIKMRDVTNIGGIDRWYYY